MSDLDAIEAIKQLKARYFRLLDTKQWAAWRMIFTNDASFEGTSRPFDGPDDFCASTSAWLDSAVTVHQGHTPEIEILDESNARGIWAMHDHVQFADPIASGAYAGMNGFIGHGYYHEHYRCDEGVWKISFLRLTRLRVDPIAPGTPLPDLPKGLLSSRSEHSH